MAGQPTKYDPAYCDQIVDYCQSGASISSFAASIGVARSTITNWANEHEQFLSAVKTAKTAIAAWYDETARKVARDGGGNATLCIFGLKNFDEEDFRDVQETKHSGNVGFTGLNVTIRKSDN